MGSVFTAEGIRKEHERQVLECANTYKKRGQTLDDVNFLMAVLKGDVHVQTEPYEETAARRRKMAKGVLVTATVCGAIVYLTCMKSGK